MKRKARRPRRSQFKPDAIQPEVVTRRLVVADGDGQCRATLATNHKTGGPELNLYDKAGHRRLQLKLKSDGHPEIALFAENGLKAMASLALNDKGLARLKMQDKDSDAEVFIWPGSVYVRRSSLDYGAGLYVSEDSASISVSSPLDVGVAHASLEASSDGSSTMTIHGRGPDSYASLKAGNDGSSHLRLGLNVQLSADRDRSGELYISGPNGSGVSLATRAREGASFAELELRADSVRRHDSVTATLEASCDAAEREAVLRFMDRDGQVRLNTLDGKPGMEFWNRESGPIKIA